MTAEQFKSIVNDGENANVEFKECRNRISGSLYETICSFLNHNGGRILVGVSDDGEILGVDSEKVSTLRNDIITSIKNHELFLPCPYFTPEILEVDGKTVLLLEIPCGESVYRYKGHFWDRNGDADIDVTDHSALLLSLFERKSPHLFEERIVERLTLADLDTATFRYCRNILAALNPSHPWLQLSDEELLLGARLAKRDATTGELKLKYAALILFGTEDSILEHMPRYRFEALFHMCTYADYNDYNKFPNRYDDRRAMRCNLIKVYDGLSKFVARYLPDRFYLPDGTTHRDDLRWRLFREIVANLCVHSDFNSGYACFFHIFKDRVVTKNPTRLLPDIPEGKLAFQQVTNYTKNPLLVRIFHELTWVEDMGSGTRNIIRYAPLYYPKYKVEVTSGRQWIFSITYMDAVENDQTIVNQVPDNVPRKSEMSQKNVTKKPEMSQEPGCNLSDEDLSLDLNGPTDKKSEIKRRKRKQGIIGLIKKNPGITINEMSESLGVTTRTIKRDLEEMTNIIERIGPTKGGKWVLKIVKGK